MTSRTKLTNAETLELYRVALSNVKAQPEIATIMAELGYDDTVIEEGKTILDETRKVYDFKKIEDDETTAAYADFSSKKEQLNNMFTLHRKKAKVVFRNEPLTAEKLAIKGSVPRTYIKWLEAIKNFYTLAISDTTIQSKLARLKVTVDDLTATSALITSVEAARAEYLKEKGESQDATKAKDAVFAKIDDWMSEFYAVARIGLEDKLTCTKKTLQILFIVLNGLCRSLTCCYNSFTF